MDDSRYQAACARFLETLGGDGGVEAILAAGYAVLGYPMHLLDPSFKLIAKAGGESLDDPRWVEYLSADASISEERLVRLKESGFLSRVQRSGKPTVDSSVSGGMDVIACDVLAGDKIIGRLGIWASKPYGPVELEIALALSRTLSAEMRKNESPALAKEKNGSFFFDRLLHERNADGAEIERLRKRYGLELPAPYRVLVLADRCRTDREGRAPQYLARKIGELIPGALCTVSDGEVALLSMPNENAEAMLTPIIEKNALACGASRLFEDLIDTPECFRQAKAALRFGAAENRIAMYEEVAHLDLLRSCARTMVPLGMDFPPVRRLASYDRDYKTDYVRTLESYIDCSCNMAETGRALGVHYNTVKYRMDVIAGVMGIRIAGIETIFKTALALLLRRDGEKAEAGS